MPLSDWQKMVHITLTKRANNEPVTKKKGYMFLGFSFNVNIVLYGGGILYIVIQC